MFAEAGRQNRRSMRSMRSVSVMSSLLAGFMLVATGVAAASPRDAVESLISSNKVMVFSKSYCGYSLRVKGLLDSLHADYKTVELDQHPEGRAYQIALLEKTGQRTVPNVFIDGKHIGGHDDTYALHQRGELEKLINSK